MHRLLKIHFPSLTSQTLEVAASGGTAEGEKEEEEEGRGRENERVIRVWHRRGRLTLFSTGKKGQILQPSLSPTTPVLLAHNIFYARH